MQSAVAEEHNSAVLWSSHVAAMRERQEEWRRRRRRCCCIRLPVQYRRGDSTNFLQEEGKIKKQTARIPLDWYINFIRICS